MDPREKAPESFLRAPALRRLSQNFLVDTDLARRLVETFSPAADDHVLEVGPGRGALTEHIVGRVARFVAVELDPRLAARLRHWATPPELHEGDILEISLAELRTTKPFRIITSLPYSISSPFVFKLVEESENFIDAHLILQLEFADRLAAVPETKAYGSLTVIAQTAFDVTALTKIGPGSFRPRPRVASRLVRLAPKKERLAAELFEPLKQLLRVAFSARRKHLGKGLSKGLGAEREFIDDTLRQLGIEPTSRPETVAPETWLALTTALRSLL